MSEIPRPFHERRRGALVRVRHDSALRVRQRHLLTVVVQAVGQGGDGGRGRHGGGRSCQNRPP